MDDGTGLFDTAALATAVDARRRALGRTWAQLASEAHVAASTIRRAAAGGDMEADGAAWLLQWLEMPSERFVRGRQVSAVEERGPVDDGLPPGAPRWHSYRRLDTAALYHALDEQRRSRGLTWEQAAAQVRSPFVRADTLRGFARGGRTGLSRLGPVLRWLDQPLEAFLTLPSGARVRVSRA